MDIVLERVLSLIPKDKSGKYVHGEKAKFAKSIGYNDGSIVSMWENGSSVSYTKKLHQIASTYNVSVEWLEGKTDDPGIKKAPTSIAESERSRQIAARISEIVYQLYPETQESCLQYFESLLALQNAAQGRDIQG